VRALPRGYQDIVFTTVDGREVPHTPWPQHFYISGQRWLSAYDAWDVRPLTFTGIVKGVGRNFITMNYWRFMIFLRVLGFLSTPETARLSWHHFTLRFWKHQMWWRFRVVRLGRRLLTKLKERMN